MKIGLIIFALNISFLLNLTILSQENNDEIIRVESSLVILNATIQDQKGAFVKNLKKSQFKILEDGVEQIIQVFETEQIPFSAVILLDTSGSMETRVSFARSAALTFLRDLRIDDQVAIYSFDSIVSLIQDFSNSRDVSWNFFDLKADGYTVLNDAIYEAAQILEKRPEKRKAIIVLSDGADTRSSKSADKALKMANSANAIIYTVDMSSMEINFKDRIQNQNALKSFAEKTGGKFIATPGGNALDEAFENIRTELGVQYTLGYQPTNTAKDGKWRTIELQVQKSDLKIRTKKGYHAEKKIKK